jgi:pimeloyl-ACP methyl ester carboxylesterase
MLRSDLRLELASITTPTLIIWGERDALLPLALGRALNTALPHATFVTLPGCGHRPMLAQPECFSQIVLDFLQANDISERG